MIDDLVQDLVVTLDAMPRKVSQYCILALLLEAIRRDLQFIDRHPTTLFQCLWNRCVWHIPSMAPTESESVSGSEPNFVEYQRTNSKDLPAIASEWRKVLGCERPGIVWLRSEIPIGLALGSPLKHVLKLPESFVHALTCSPDGQLVASASGLRSVTATLDMTFVTDTATSSAQSIIRPTRVGEWILTPDNPIRIWNMALGHECGVLTGHTATVVGLAFTPDGQKLISGSMDGTIRYWRLDSLVEETCLDVGGPVCAFALSADGTTLVTAMPKSREVRLWEAYTGRLLQTLSGLSHDATAVCLSPDGVYVAAGAGTSGMFFSSFPKGQLRVWDTTTGKVLDDMMTDRGKVSCLAWSPTNRFVAVGTYSGNVRFLEPKSGAVTGDANVNHPRVEPTAHTAVAVVAFAPNGERLACGLGNSISRNPAAQAVSILSVPDGAELTRLQGHDMAVTAVAFTPDGRRVISGTLDGQVYIWDLDLMRRQTSWSHFKWPIVAITFSPEGQRVAVGIGGDTIIRNWQAGQQDVVCRFGNASNGAVFSPDGKWLACSNSSDKQIRIFDAKTGAEQVLIRYAHVEIPQQGCFSPDSRLFVAQEQVWDIILGQKMAELHGHRNWVQCLAFSPDGEFLVSCDAVAKVWSTADLKELSHFDDHQGEQITATIFSQSGKMVATIDRNGIVCLWDAKTTECHAQFETSVSRQCDNRIQLSFSPDDSLLVVWSSEHRIEIWSVAEQRRLHWFDDCNTDLAAVAAGDSICPFWLCSSNDGTFVRVAADDSMNWAPAAWCFNQLSHLTVNRTTWRTWAGAHGSQLHIYTLDNGQFDQC